MKNRSQSIGDEILELIMTYELLLRRTIELDVDNPIDVEDVYQETVLAILDHFHKGKQVKHPKAWMVKIAKSKCVGFHRQSNALFFVSLASVPIGVGIASIRKEKSSLELATLFTIAWALVWFSLARDGKRFGFFISIPLAFSTASLLWHFPRHLIQILKTRLPAYVTHGWITTSSRSSLSFRI